jgi:hypothetical protein
MENFTILGGTMRKTIDLTVLALATILFCIFVFLPIARNNHIPVFFSYFLNLFFFITFMLIIWSGLILFKNFQYEESHPVPELLRSIVFFLTGIIISGSTLVRFAPDILYLLVICLELYCIPMSFFHTIKPFLSTISLESEKPFYKTCAAILVAVLFFSTNFFQFINGLGEMIGIILFYCIPGGIISSIFIIIKINNFWKEKKNA